MVTVIGIALVRHDIDFRLRSNFGVLRCSTVSVNDKINSYLHF